MQVQKACIGENGRILLPAAMRKEMGLKGGDEVTLLLDEQGLRIQTTRQMIAQAQAIARKYAVPGQSLVEELIAERRLEVEREAER